MKKMMYRYPIRSNELYHYGVKGMHWGVRRFQNPDGTLIHPKTDRGKNSIKTDINGERNILSTRPNRVVDTNKSSKDNPTAGLARVLSSAALNTTLATATAAVQASSPVIIPELVMFTTLTAAAAAIDAKSAVKGIKAGHDLKAENKRIEKSKGEIDKATGFHMKTKECTPEEDLKHVNPGYNNFNKDTKSNCMLCTSAYELRRRGYDVTANFAATGFQHNKVNAWFPDAKIKGSDPSKLSKLSDQEQIKLLKEAETCASKGTMHPRVEKDVNALKKEPEGSRGNLMIIWCTGSGGHSMAYEIKNGKVIVRDGQSNQIYNNPEKTVFPYTVNVNYARLDNCKINTKTIKEVAR